MNAVTPIRASSPVYHDTVEQGSLEWLQRRCGLLTASEMKLIVTPTLKVASNDKQRVHLYELLAQRVTGHVEPHYISDDMLRGHEDEVRARIAYAEHHAPVDTVGFVTNDAWGFTIGYSPDGIVGGDGLIECKSRCAKYQMQTIVENDVPAEYLIQLQTALLVTGREWIDFISYSGGLPMFVKRVLPDAEMQEAIIGAAWAFEQALAEHLEIYTSAARDMIPTERVIELEMYA